MAKLFAFGVLTTLVIFWVLLIFFAPKFALAWVAIFTILAIAGSKPWRTP